MRTLACWPSVIKTGVLWFCARRQRTCLPPSKQKGWTVTSRGAASAEPGRLAASAFAVLSTSLIQDVPISSYAFSTAVTLRVFQVSLECGWQSETLRPFVLVIFWPPFTPGLVKASLRSFSDVSAKTAFSASTCGEMRREIYQFSQGFEPVCDMYTSICIRIYDELSQRRRVAS